MLFNYQCSINVANIIGLETISLNPAHQNGLVMFQEELTSKVKWFPSCHNYITNSLTVLSASMLP